MPRILIVEDEKPISDLISMALTGSGYPCAAAADGLAAADLLELSVVDEVIPEPPGGAHRGPAAVFAAVDRALSRHLHEVCKAGSPAARREKKFRAMGAGLVHPMERT